MDMKKLVLRAVVVAQLIAAPFAVSAATTTSQTVVTTSTFAENSVERQSVVAWLQQHAAHVNGKLIGEFDQIGAVTVTTTREIAGGRAYPQSPGDGPPVPLPANGVPGQTISVSTCSHGVSQSWSYVWVPANNGGGTWALTSYKYNQVACGSGSTWAATW
ncbi:hypothetical protein E4A48_14845 [Xanthomonas cerealis pv. cerealis]|uniref:Uncharacterized protein n=2 Tax=Xanthomonas translucens group TaxID=3390202 RepID=A0A514EFI6_9XANT|nr:hypothetical protein [Xanthomonas translucens]QDI04797.1 hypothetical protein E4A48_14845 [Xanthomonas translucens pv. cerealis]